MNHLTSEVFDLYLDDRLDPSARADVDAHLAGCVRCRDELAALRGVFLALDALEPEPMPVDLTSRVLERVAPAPARSRFSFARVLLCMQVALIVLLAIWLGPMLSGWAQVRPLALPTVPSLDLDMLLLAWLDARTLEFQAALASVGQAGSALGAGRLVGFAPAQWALVVAAVGVVWLVGNRLLLAGPHRPRDARQEARW